MNRFSSFNQEWDCPGFGTMLQCMKECGEYEKNNLFDGSLGVLFYDDRVLVRF